MKALICYSSNQFSNAVSSATIDKYKKENPKDIKIEQFNLEKKNIKKYFLNEDISKPEVIYVFYRVFNKFEDTLTFIQKEFNVKIIVYKTNIVYEPVRRHSLETKVYYLYDKILYDMENNFEKVQMYQVARNVNKIDIVELYNFEANSDYAKKYMIESHNCYHTLDEAKEHVKLNIK